MNSLERCMAAFQHEKVEAHGSGFRALGANTMADGFLFVFRHQALKFGLGVFVLEMGRPCPVKDAGKLCPGVGAAHVDNPDGLDAPVRQLDLE